MAEIEILIEEIDEHLEGPFEEVIDYLQELERRAKNYHQYKRFQIKRTPNGYIILVGFREETKQEERYRKETEESARKQIESVELREYQRLREKYAKSNHAP